MMFFLLLVVGRRKTMVVCGRKVSVGVAGAGWPFHAHDVT